MSGPEDPTTNTEQPLAEPNDRNPASAPGPAAPDDDRFAATFAAARGTISPELDLSGILDEPIVTVEDADVGHRRPRS